MEQLVARWAHNPKVVCSSHTPATKAKPVTNSIRLFLYITAMFTVYVLFSKEFNKIYIGFTSDLEKRLIAHNHPKNKGWTKKYSPWEVVYTETFDHKEEAVIREKQLKSAKGREFVWSVIKKIQ